MLIHCATPFPHALHEKYISQTKLFLHITQTELEFIEAINVQTPGLGEMDQLFGHHNFTIWLGSSFWDHIKSKFCATILALRGDLKNQIPSEIWKEDQETLNEVWDDTDLQLNFFREGIRDDFKRLLD